MLETERRPLPQQPAYAPHPAHVHVSPSILSVSVSLDLILGNWDPREAKEGEWVGCETQGKLGGETIP